MNETTAIIAGTSMIIFMVIVNIFFVVIAISKINRFQKRDLHYMERISGLESLIKKEFVELIQSLKI